MSYENECRERCQLCAAGVPLDADRQLHIEPWMQPESWPSCTAPTRDQYIAELEAKNAELQADVTRLEDAHYVLSGVAELRAENARLKRWRRLWWLSAKYYRADGKNWLAERDRLKAQLTEAQKALAEERARLDWLESQMVLRDEESLRDSIDAARAAGGAR